MNSCIYESPIGKIRLVERKGSLVQAKFTEKILRSDVSLEYLEDLDSKILIIASQRLEKYFCGDLKFFNLPLKVEGTFFQRCAWRALSSIPYGETWSYQQQAKHIDNPKATRAIGNANSRNPLTILIPCHRVISKSGDLNGYSAGIERKSYLIELEKRFKRVHED
tara:strand:+ start:611 stop:1105 length:495 start_codon:yes stop_codon:yes gene_type:complete